MKESTKGASCFLVTNVCFKVKPEANNAILESSTEFTMRNPSVFLPNFASVRTSSVSLHPGAKIIFSFILFLQSPIKMLYLAYCALVYHNFIKKTTILYQIMDEMG